MDTHGDTEFWSRLLDEIIAAFPRYYGRDNWDAERFGAYPRSITESLVLFFNRYTRSTVNPLLFSPRASNDLPYALIQPWLPDYAKTYSLLADDYSRSLFIRLIAYRILGFHKVKLPLAIHYSDLQQKKDTIRLAREKTPAAEKIMRGNWVLHLMDLGHIGFPVRCYSTESGITAAFLLKQYEYRHGSTTIAVSPGDYVIDAGGGWGDTALFFAHAAGTGGMVFSFEFLPENLEVFLRNLALNPALSGRIHIAALALWDRSDEVIHYAANGPGTTITPEYEQRSCQKELQVGTISIDDFVLDNGLERVDYIKMDIEAAELHALKGAVKTIRKFRPTLAVALYHKISDYAEIPLYIQGLDLGYSLFIDHFTIHHEETVLFAVPDEKLAGRERNGSPSIA